jgi:hypothetical protein
MYDRFLRIAAVHGSVFEPRDTDPSRSRPECPDSNSGLPRGSFMLRVWTAWQLTLTLRRPQCVGVFVAIYTITAFLRHGRPESSLKS